MSLFNYAGSNRPQNYGNVSPAEIANAVGNSPLGGGGSGGGGGGGGSAGFKPARWGRYWNTSAWEKGPNAKKNPGGNLYTHDNQQVGGTGWDWDGYDFNGYDFGEGATTPQGAGDLRQYARSLIQDESGKANWGTKKPKTRKGFRRIRNKTNDRVNAFLGTLSRDGTDDGENPDDGEFGVDGGSVEEVLNDVFHQTASSLLGDYLPPFSADYMQNAKNDLRARGVAHGQAAAREGLDDSGAAGFGAGSGAVAQQYAADLLGGRMQGEQQAMDFETTAR